eukprot:scaffold180354_cov18-Tisochrysis_lutea.AAC.1
MQRRCDEMQLYSQHRFISLQHRCCTIRHVVIRCSDVAIRCSCTGKWTMLHDKARCDMMQRCCDKMQLYRQVDAVRKGLQSKRLTARLVLSSHPLPAGPAADIQCYKSKAYCRGSDCQLCANNAVHPCNSVHPGCFAAFFILHPSCFACVEAALTALACPPYLREHTSSFPDVRKLCDVQLVGNPE